MTQEWDAAIAALAGRQRTLVTHDQLLAIGCSRRTIAHWVERERLHAVFHGVYSVIHGELPPLGREQAALLACGKRAFLSYWTAAAIWKLVPELPFEVEVSVVGRRCGSRKGIRAHEIKAIDRRDVRQEQGLWVSSPTRAVLEISATASEKELIRAIDEGLAKRLFTPASWTTSSPATDRAEAPPGWRRSLAIPRRPRSADPSARRPCSG
jgi:hypothetical protein